MSAFVIDVNVLIVANARETAQASPQCVLHCVEFLELARENLVVLDDLGLIFGQYQRYNSFQGQPGLGDALFKWIFNKQFDSKHCELVEVIRDGLSFTTVPLALRGFDLSDHVYIAIARASDYQPVIVNATDNDWFEWQEKLEQKGLKLNFLCPERMNKSKYVE
jgi:hypothetical protein